MMRRTTRRGAYKKNAKRQFQKRRAPFVETKSQTDVLVAAKANNLTNTPIDEIRLTTEPLLISYGTAATPKELTILPLNSFMNMNPGFTSADMIGSSIYSRYLKCKVEFQLPYGSNQIRHPCDMFLIHGFITQPLGTTLHTVPDTLNLSRADYTEHIQEQLEQYFNQRADKLEYIPKRTSNIKFLGYRKLKVKKNANLGPPPIAGLDSTSITQAGAHPVINMTCNFPMKRKVHYNKGDSNIAAYDFYYPNHSFLPFVALFNPTANEFLSTVTYPGSGPATNNPPSMYVRYNSIHYFSDS
jgi:hypothetical protein